MRVAFVLLAAFVLGAVIPPAVTAEPQVPDKIGPMCIDSMDHFWNPESGELPIQSYWSNAGHTFSEFVPDAMAGGLVPGSERPVPGTLHIQIVCDLHDAVKECVEGLLSINADRIQECIDGAATP